MRTLLVFLACMGGMSCATDPGSSGRSGDVIVSLTLTPTVVQRGDKFYARVVRTNRGSTRVEQISGAECPAEFRVFRGDVSQGPYFPEIWWECRLTVTPFPLAPGDSQVFHFPVTAGGTPGEYEFRVLWYLSAPSVPNLAANFVIR